MQTNAKILIIEDERSIVVAIESLFRSHTKSLRTVALDHAYDLKTGMERAHDAHLIILDLTLPDSKDPMETLKNAVPELSKSAPVIVLTGREDGNFPLDRDITIQGISEYGADAVLYKSMIQTQGGMEWLMLVMQCSLLRRAYDITHKS